MPKFYLNLKGGGQVAKDDFGRWIAWVTQEKPPRRFWGIRTKQAPRRSIPFSRSLLWTRMVKKC